MAKKVRVQFGQVKEQAAESAMADEALQLQVVDRTHAEATLAGGSRTLEEIERLHILMVLQKTGGLIEGPKGAAGILGLNPSTLRGRIKKLGIRRKSRQISREHRELPQRPPSLADN